VHLYAHKIRIAAFACSISVEYCNYYFWRILTVLG